MGRASCVFCDILEARQPASIVCKDDVCVAFMDIHPINPGHVLVVPRRHAVSLQELDEGEGVQVFCLARRIAVALRTGALAGSGVRCEAVNLLLSDGTAAGQVVPHIHLHVVPRWFGDGAGFRRGALGRRTPSRKELDGLAAALAGAVRVSGDE